jgi:hypothetical protein
MIQFSSCLLNYHRCMICINRVYSGYIYKYLRLLLYPRGRQSR